MPDDAIYAPFSIVRRADGTRFELGRGAMGTTYKATDTQLGRTVALKVINSLYLDSEVVRQRFLAEARAAAQLQHPNVASVYQLRADGENVFYAMEFVDGETVEALVKRRGPLPLRLGLQIVLQAAQGLAAASERGLIHRDIKPANLMVVTSTSPAERTTELADGENLLVKVIDFGLAKNVATDAGAAGLTGDFPVGTPLYMSPEQISPPIGKTLDSRTDIYALGVTLWYILAGRTPFAGSQYQVLVQHLQEQPKVEELLKIGTPPEVTALVGSMLAKNRDERPANHTALIGAIRELLRKTTLTSKAKPLPPQESDDGSADATIHLAPTHSGQPSESGALTVIPSDLATTHSIAVLPFVNRSQDLEDEYFSDGLADELLNVLSKVRGMRVAARSSAFTFKGKSVTVAEAGRALNVANILEGSVRKSKNQVRISVQLVKVSDGYHLWAETYDRTLEDIFAVQDDIAQSVVKELRSALLGETDTSAGTSKVSAEVAEAAKGRGHSPESHRLFLQGRFLVDRLTRTDVAKGIGYLKQALKLDAANALAWVWLSRAHWLEEGYAWSPLGEGRAHARAAAERAVELAPNLAEGHLALGKVRLQLDWNWSGADASFSRALEIAPDSPLVQLELASAERFFGRLDKALTFAEKAMTQDPLNLLGYLELGRIYRLMNLPSKAEEMFRKALEISPGAVNAHAVLSFALVEQGRIEEAREVAEKEGQWGSRLYALIVVHHAVGNHAEAHRLLQEFSTQEGLTAAFQIAAIHAVLGETTAAFEWLEKAYMQRDAGLISVRADVHLRSLQEDARWNAFLAKMGIPV